MLPPALGGLRLAKACGGVEGRVKGTVKSKETSEKASQLETWLHHVHKWF